MLKKLQIILLVLSLSTLLHAKTFKGEVASSGNVGCQALTQKESPYIASLCVDKVKIKYKLYSMTGEPLEFYAVYWELSPYINLMSGSVLASTLPAKVQEAYAKVSLHYKSKFIIDLYQSQQYRASFRFSGGALKRSGKGYSFDTPGSPSWDKYMLRSDSGNDYYSKKEAIGIFKSTPEHAASFSFNKIENLAFTNLYALNSALKPKKEKKKQDKELTPKEEDTAKQKPQTQQKINQKTNTALATKDYSKSLEYINLYLEKAGNNEKYYRDALLMSNQAEEGLVQRAQKKERWNQYREEEEEKRRIEAAIPRHTLTILPTPSNARVQIKYIKDRYRDGIRLKPGSYSLKVSKKGYKSKEFTVNLNKDIHRSVKLKKIKKKKSSVVWHCTARSDRASGWVERVGLENAKNGALKQCNKRRQTSSYCRITNCYKVIPSLSLSNPLSLY